MIYYVFVAAGVNGGCSLCTLIRYFKGKPYVSVACRSFARCVCGVVFCGTVGSVTLFYIVLHVGRLVRVVSPVARECLERLGRQCALYDCQQRLPAILGVCFMSRRRGSANLDESMLS